MQGVVHEGRCRNSQSGALFTGGRVRKPGCRLGAEHWMSLDMATVWINPRVKRATVAADEKAATLESAEVANVDPGATVEADSERVGLERLDLTSVDRCMAVAQ